MDALKYPSSRYHSNLIKRPHRPKYRQKFSQFHKRCRQYQAQVLSETSFKVQHAARGRAFSQREAILRKSIARKYPSRWPSIRSIPSSRARIRTRTRCIRCTIRKDSVHIPSLSKLSTISSPLYISSPHTQQLARLQRYEKRTTH
jgi:hypothetical protein